MCYEPNYPRTHSIRVGYVLEKLFLALGLLAAGMHIVTGSIVPVCELTTSLVKSAFPEP